MTTCFLQAFAFAVLLSKSRAIIFLSQNLQNSKGFCIAAHMQSKFRRIRFLCVEIQTIYCRYFDFSSFSPFILPFFIMAQLLLFNSLIIESSKGARK